MAWVGWLAFELEVDLFHGLVESFSVLLLHFIIERLLAEDEHIGFELVLVSQDVDDLSDGLVWSLDVQLHPVVPF